MFGRISVFYALSRMICILDRLQMILRVEWQNFGYSNSICKCRNKDKVLVLVRKQVVKT